MANTETVETQETQETEETEETEFKKLEIEKFMDFGVNHSNGDEPFVKLLLTEGKEQRIPLNKIHKIKFNRPMWDNFLNFFQKEYGLNSIDDIIKLHKRILTKDGFTDHIKLKIFLLAMGKPLEQLPEVQVNNTPLRNIFNFQLSDLLEIIYGKACESFAFDIEHILKPDQVSYIYIIYIHTFHMRNCAIIYGNPQQFK